MQAVTETVDSWLRQMSQDWATPIALNEEGTCSIKSGNGYTLELFIMETAGSCYFSIPLMDVPHQHREAFYETVLAVNVHQQETHGATLAVDPNDLRLLLCYSQPVPALTFEHFHNLIQNLMSTADTVVTKIEEQRLETSSTTQMGSNIPSNANFGDKGDTHHHEYGGPMPLHQFSHFTGLV